MSESQLSFASTEVLRNELIKKNLAPYNVPGFYSPPGNLLTYETTLSDLSINKIAEEQISNIVYSDKLYPLNQFGPEGGYDKDLSYNNPPLPVNSNQGPYDIGEADLGMVSTFFLEELYLRNSYGPEGGYDIVYEVGVLQNPNNYYLPYWEPPIFRPSSYTPYSILMSDNPVGSDGSISLDSKLAQLSAKQLQSVLVYRAALSDNTSAQLIGDAFAFSQPSAASNQLRGNILTPNNDFRITKPSDTDTFLTRLQGVYTPSSPIPGDYFLDEQSTRSTGSIGQLINVFAGRSTLLGDVFGPAFSRNINPSVVFLESTGAGQKSALFENLSYNRFKPQYGSSSLGGIAQNLLVTGINAILNSTGTQLPGDFYVGSVISNPSSVESPVRDVPIDAFGKETGAIVYGPTELANLYEGNDSSINFGLQALPTTDAGGIMGNFVWISPKYKDNAGFKMGPGGKSINQDPEFNQISSDYENSLSTNINFKVGSILDETQRLIDSADHVGGIRRLKHVGNAINQVSKVFNDGYKELTKGSKVVSYLNQNGEEVGQAYCRVFAKDTPYYTFADLQKTDGNIRKFTYSVLDNTFNLNIAPLAGNNSTNITNGQVKKYMFSIENLAWRNSNRTGLRWEDLPVCERGPNKGRIMWFPPYDLKFNETSTPSFNSTTFLGRPEPVYTYKDTNRSGSISWKIIVDHPSILNVIINKVLQNERNRVKVNSIVDSFFAGCKKYDIYELASRYNTIPTKDLLAYQEIISNPRLTREQLANVNNSIPKDGRSEANASNITNEEPSVNDLQSNVNLGFYFANSVPEIPTRYDQLYLTYSTSPSTDTGFTKNVLTPSFDQAKEFVQQLLEVLQSEKSKITISWDVSYSYNEGYDNSTKPNILIEKRIESVIDFIKNYPVDGKTLKQYVDNGDLTLMANEETISSSITISGLGQSYNCSSPETPTEDQIRSFACRSVRVKNISIVSKGENQQTQTPTPKTDINSINTGIKPSPNTDPLSNLKQGVSKKIIRNLLSECDYFNIIEETNPMIYDTIREKIKYFNPTFHSMTPEGLNSRLTFLQQCVRPGDTIPTTNEDGTPRYNDAINTSFGTPPVLILRVGDFYNTKIIPTSLQLSYEPLIFDLNPEGIGVQPMIANVTLSFNFIGGSGLAKPIEQLQNALSFNYYANTEMYDERAEATEDVSKLDRQVVQSILDSQPPVTQPQEPISNNGGTFIGTIISSSATTTGTTGVIAYEKIMDDFVDQTQTYFDTISNQLKTLVEGYNRGVMEIVSIQRQYSSGNIGPNNQSAPIYGKPENVQEGIDTLFQDVVNEISNKTSPLIAPLVTSGFADQDLRKLINNLINYINDYKQQFSIGVFSSIQEMVNFQQNYVQYIRKLNFIYNSVDGKIEKNGTATVYNILGTNEVTPPTNGVTTTYFEFSNDYEEVGIDLDSFINYLTTENVLSTTYTSSSGNFNSLAELKTYMVLCQIFIDSAKLTDFKNKIIDSTLTSVNSPQNLQRKFGKICDDLAGDYKKEHSKNVKYIDDVFGGSSYKDYKKYKPFSRGKKRKFTYDSNPVPAQSIAVDLQNIYKNVNIDNNTSTYLNKVKFN